MIDKVEKSVHENKTLGLNNPKNYVLRDNRFNNKMVLIFIDSNKAQIYKTPD